MSVGARPLYGGMLACVLAIAVSAGSLLPYMSDSAELVRLRNALLVEDKPTSFDWTPATVPADFKLETGSANPFFVEVVAGLELQQYDADWERALAMAGHLLENRQGPVGGAIQSSLEETYRVIRETGTGYCGDYADVFTAMALAAGIPVRSWAFSFDGFGGNGHIFNEVWDEQDGSWKAIDPFHNLYFVGEADEVLSAQEFRRQISVDPDGPMFRTIYAGAKPVFRHEHRAREFYIRGTDEWYLWWGNNVFSQESAGLVRAFSKVHRAAEQMAGILHGVAPAIRVLLESRESPGYAAILRLQSRLYVTFWIAAIAAIALVVFFMLSFLRRKPGQKQAGQ